MALENNLCDRDELQAFFRETGWDLELLLPEGTGKTAKAASGFSIDPAFHPY